MMDYIVDYWPFLLIGFLAGFIVNCRKKKP